MAVRKPIYIDGSNNLIEMTTAEVLEWTEQVCFLYGSSPSVTLSVVGSSGSLASLDDTRLAAGATSQSSTAFPNEATTAEPSTVTVTYDKVTKTNASVSPTVDTGTTWPVYINGDNDLQAMNLTDVKDTFLHPAIDLLVSGTESATTAGTYTVTTTATPATNYSVVSATPIFVDTRADTSLYSAAGIPETLDQPTTITSYYLHLRTGTDTTPARDPVFINGSNDIQTFTEGTIDGLFTEWIRETASESGDGFQITYTVATSGGNTRGTPKVDTKLDGAGEHRTLQVGDDYRAQEHPNGSAQTITTTALRINKA